MNTEVNEQEMQLSDAEKKAIMDAREAAKKKEAYTQEMQEFYLELDALCKKTQRSSSIGKCRSITHR
jgi:hypothetical protein